MAKKKTAGGLKGLIQSTGTAVYAAGVLARDYGTVAARFSYQYGGSLAFAVATTSMIVLMPLMFESSREVQVCCLSKCGWICHAGCHSGLVPV